MSDFSPFIIFITISYLIGSIPFGLLFAKAFGAEDLRKKGSGNIGATNALRVGGKKLGILTLVFDMLKGAVPVMFAEFSDFELWQQVMMGLVAIIGHIAPIWLKFKGGKGVATTLAVLFSLDLSLGIAMAVSWLVVFLITKISSLSSLVSIFFVTFFSMIASDEMVIIIALWSITGLIVYKHKENIYRLLNKQEKSV